MYVDIYQMFLRMCKLIIWMVSEKKDQTEVHTVNDFFMVYVKGLQGFVEKIDITGYISMSDVALYVAILEMHLDVTQMKTKIQDHAR